MTDRIGCVECGWTGLHVLGDATVEPVLEIERHDGCATFTGDVEAAQFVALCHPRYTRLVYRAHRGTVHSYPIDALPADIDPVEWGGVFYLAVPEAAAGLALNLAESTGRIVIVDEPLPATTES